MVPGLDKYSVPRELIVRSKLERLSFCNEVSDVPRREHLAFDNLGRGSLVWYRWNRSFFMPKSSPSLAK